MISFSCSRCGMKLKVKDEFAGRASRCPTCKQALIVPAPERTIAGVVTGEIEGTSSSLARAGMDGGGITLEHAASSARAGQRSVPELLGQRTKKDGRYLLDHEIARGGMGVVLRAVDCDIRREVAVKYLLDQSDTGKKLRFIEEAQITGQLEHPNIVPIHELGVDHQQRLFFSMKMVKGRSLAEVLDLHRTNPKAAEQEFSLGRLLNTLVNVCNALAYAHSRGVIHRDLKPANIMLGDFGEVYVMDWGLAKVLSGGQPDPRPTAVAVAPVPQLSAQRPSKVRTSREPEADLTQEGAVLGTPVYMPPEQASGNVQAVDHRSDIYSLGAILYELLTLQPPIAKEDGYLAILLRVMEGEIVPPAQRDSRRARAGKIPRELSAIAMKALAKNPQDRYPTVEALRRDIERFQEGKSVSAKDDTFREAVWKLVKRNKGVSVTACLALLVLTIVLWFSFQGLYGAYTSLRQEQEAKRELGKATAPLFFQDAKISSTRKQIAYALAQVTVALDYDPKIAEARLLKGQLLIVTNDFTSAQKELEQYVRQRPDDRDAAGLLDLCKHSRPKDSTGSTPFIEILARQKAFGLAEAMEQDQDKLVRLYRQRIERAWPGHGSRLTMDRDGKCRLSVSQGGVVVKDLTPLQGIPLTSLELSDCDQLRDLTPLTGIPITVLSLARCGQVRDLTPLQGMKLTSLNLINTAVRDLTPLKGLPLTNLNLFGCGQVRDLTPLQGMKLTSLTLTNTTVLDLTPLNGMPLATLSLHACRQVSDLTPLKDLPLTSLDISYCDLIRDLTPLKSMRLTSLSFYNCGQARDLTPLQGTQLTFVLFTPKNITKGMDVFRHMGSLKTIAVGSNTGIRFKAEEFWKRYDAGEFK